MKPTKRAKKQEKSKPCDHAEAYALSVFHRYDPDDAILIMDCPDCGATIEVVGAFVESK